MFFSPVIWTRWEVKTWISREPCCREETPGRQLVDALSDRLHLIIISCLVVEQVSRWVMSRLRMNTPAGQAHAKEKEEHQHEMLCLDERHTTGAVCISGTR